MADFQVPADEEIRGISEILSKIEDFDPRQERRTSPRHPYPVIQLAAPYGDFQLPTKKMFRGVPCHDISTSGISLLLPRPPDFEYAVVGLGTPPNLIYLTVRVMHYRQNPGPTKGYLIGCQFLGRVHVSA